MGAYWNATADPERRASRFTYQWKKAMTSPAEVWIADDDSSIRWVLERALTKAHFQNQSFADADQLLQQMAQEQPARLVRDGVAQ